MTREAIYSTIKKAVHTLLPDARVVLFGSHARGDHNEHSDYDLLIISPHTFTRQERLSYSSQIDRAIVKAIHAPVDLLLYSEEEIIKKSELPGHIVRYAMQEGVAL
ncbi:nucleotidyltransferase domain-containing protein [Nemorincola caseinilytica]|uniref:Nucleotidyltransferase domain-containing protein n=1 Tax=Nemorincola caseinilytica TaxID=2054315 RepID=A0ABP8NBY0_9BACT